MAHASLTCLVVIFMSTIKLVSSSHEDACDWINSGEAPASGRGVQSVYLRCSRGRISWRWPSGALRIVLHLGSSRKNFRGCIKINSEFHQTGRIYLEGDRHLHLLVSKNDGRPRNLHRCFSSRRGQVSFYVEADSHLILSQNGRIDFVYQLQPRSQRDILDFSAECRPCSNAELLHYYCTSDFVLEAQVVRINHNLKLQMTEVFLKISRILRKTSFTFNDLKLVYVPLKCGIGNVVGDFVIFGTNFLNQPMIQCAPRLEEWMGLRTKALRMNINQCKL